MRTIVGAATALDAPNGLLAVSAPAAATSASPGQSASTAELAATVTPHGAPTTYYFEYGPTTSYGAKTATVNAGAGPGPQNVFASAVRLSPGAQIHYRIVATNSTGTTVGTDRTVTTSAGGLTAVPMTFVSNAPAVGSVTSTAPPSILGFPIGARGNLAPAVTISGPQTGLTAPIGVAVDNAGDLFTADFAGNQILEYAPGARGDVAPIARIPIPPSTNGANGPAGLAISPTGILLVSKFQDPAILEFTRDSAGNWGLLHAIAGDQTGLSGPLGVAFGSGGAIVVADELSERVLEFRVNAHGNVAPFRIISGAQTGLSVPSGVAVDDTGAVWVADQSTNTVSLFGPGASGDAPPFRTFAGALRTPIALAPDGAGHVLVADVAGKVAEFARTASGNQAPFASLMGSQTGIVAPFGVAIKPRLLGISTASLPAATTGTAYAQTVGASGGARPYHWSLSSGSLPAGVSLNALTGAITGTPTTAQTSKFTVKVTDVSQPTAQSTVQSLSIMVRPPIVPSVYTTNGGSGTITDYAITPLGNVSPLLTLGASNKLNAPDGVAVDSTGRLYAVNGGGNSISEFPPYATSSSRPDIVISGTATGLTSPSSIALDAAGRIYVTSQSASTVTVFASGATGNATPIATISGPHTTLNAPAAATVNSAGDVWVANAGNNSLTEYAPGANGDAPPIATVAGSATLLDGPVAIGQDENGNLLVANRFAKSIGLFAPAANGNVSPDSVIGGVDTTLDFPDGVDVDSQGRIYVANQFNNTIAVFAPDAAGDATPVGMIAGVATGLSGPGAIAVAPPLSILSRSMAEATVGELYQSTLEAAMGTTPYRWSVRSGHLPPGLRLSRSGILSGVPRRPGRWVFTIAVADASRPRMTDRRSLSLTVGRAVLGSRRPADAGRGARLLVSMGRK